MNLGPDIFLRVPVILLSLTVHELAHALSAKRLGDPTADAQGRITLNPIAHLDPIGTIMLLFGPFGWAKPVQVNPYNLRDPRKDMIVIAFAGPLANIILAGITGLLFRFGLNRVDTSVNMFLWYMFYINIGLAFFNLLPVKPLDGSRILAGFLKGNNLIQYERLMTYAPMVFLGMIVAEYYLNIPIISTILNPLFKPFYRSFLFIFVGHSI